MTRGNKTAAGASKGSKPAGAAAEATPASSSSASSGYREPGWRHLPSTSLFRAVNPELYVRPNKVVMGFGLIAMTGCVAFLAYLRATDENQKDSYNALNEDGSLSRRTKVSKWD